ncbi:hypothetical protein [Actinomadura soli]|uniref:hypothetical protein n=1 Tax=Actinomadura soli TaxID=2508997 RepID=UPI00197A74BD|nr:hypothetical protein [Actinomadura soli]
MGSEMCIRGRGFVGGHAFEDDPLKGVAVGIGLALSVTAVVEGVRFLRRRRGAAAVPDGRGVEAADRVGPMSGV